MSNGNSFVNIFRYDVLMKTVIFIYNPICYNKCDIYSLKLMCLFV